MLGLWGNHLPYARKVLTEYKLITDVTGTISHFKRANNTVPNRFRFKNRLKIKQYSHTTTSQSLKTP